MLAEAVTTLPDAVEAETDVAETELNLAFFGRVRFTARRMRFNVGPTTSMSWCIERAEYLA